MIMKEYNTNNSIKGYSGCKLRCKISVEDLLLVSIPALNKVKIIIDVYAIFTEGEAREAGYSS